MKFRFSTLLVLILLFAAQSVAQVYRGIVQGTVTDQSGAAVPNATVTLLDTQTQVRTVRKADSSGLYLFNLLIPDTYTVTVEASGFEKFVQENIVVMASSNITVNATLRPGTVRQVVTVTAAPPVLQSNTSNQTVALNSTLSQETPRYDQNPFKLTLLAPEAVNTRSEMEPYLSWSANSVDLGGGTNLKNNLTVDGSTVDVGHKYTYPPNMEDVQETTVEQTGVDAQYGHSAGGTINITTKSGSDQWHGTVDWLGRYPWLNALYNRTTSPVSTLSTRQNTIGAGIGGPIIKNKLFMFTSFNYWKYNSPSTETTTVPTVAQRNGDFSQTYNINGSVATIYNPFSSVYNPATGQITRTPFPNNTIPQSMIDPDAAKLMADFWDPNGPGVNITGADNFQLNYPSPFGYWNYSERLDYDISPKWKVFGRVSGYHTEDIPPNITPNDSELYVPAGTLRTAHQEMGDAVWTINPTTILDFHGSYDSLIDAYVSPTKSNEYASIWPGNPWYTAYSNALPGDPAFEYLPYLDIGGNGFGGSSLYWDQRPAGEDFSADYSHTMGSHYLRAGIEWRRTGGFEYIEDDPAFDFDTAFTANTSISPNTLLYGNGFASFLTGALSNDSEMLAGPNSVSYDQYYGMYIQDDWKVTRRLTLNLGLRDEYETAWYGPDMSRGLNLNASVPQMVANPPVLPTAATSLEPSSYYSGLTNGLWQWDAPGQGMWNPPALALAPRAGFAFMIDPKSVLRFGYARYVVPSEYNFTSAPVSGFEDMEFVEPPYFGMTGYQYEAPLLEGVPQETFSNPFPSTSPLAPIPGPSGGTNIGRGGSPLVWYPDNFKKAYNDRFDINIQRQLPGGIMAGFTWFFNRGRQLYTKQLNAVNPELEVKYQTALDVTVNNPFYHYLNTTINEGPYYSQATLPLWELLVPYPQYGSSGEGDTTGGLYEIGVCCNGEFYSQPQIQLLKQFSNGLTFTFGYVHVFETTQTNDFNDLDYYNNQFVWQDSDQPANHMDFAAVWHLPIGQGQPFLNSSSRAVDALLGGWEVSPVLQWVSGDTLTFGGMDVAPGNVCTPSGPNKWFNTSLFSPYPANTYVLRENPVSYNCITGPSFWDLDASLMKNFKIFERFNAQLRITAYNATNRLNLGDPDTTVTDSTFGEDLFQGAPTATDGAQGDYEYTTGRQVELGFKLTW